MILKEILPTLEILGKATIEKYILHRIFHHTREQIQGNDNIGYH